MKPERLAVVALVGTSVQGRFNGPEILHKAFPVKVAPVIVALEPSAATCPVNAMLQGIGVHTNGFMPVAIVPVALKAAPAWANVAALTMEEANTNPSNTAAKEIRGITCCIVLTLNFLVVVSR